MGSEFKVEFKGQVSTGLQGCLVDSLMGGVLSSEESEGHTRSKARVLAKTLWRSQHWPWMSPITWGGGGIEKKIMGNK